jgi:hypothetical protein
MGLGLTVAAGDGQTFLIEDLTARASAHVRFQAGGQNRECGTGASEVADHVVPDLPFRFAEVVRGRWWVVGR